MAYRYSLTFEGVNIEQDVPLDVAPVRLSYAGPGGGTSQMTFTIEDNGTVVPPAGAIVELRDTYSTSGLRFRGLLLQAELRAKSGGGRLIECTVAGPEWSLDVRQITLYDSRNTNGVLLSKDDLIVKALLDDVGLAAWYAGGFVQRTNSETDLDRVYLSGQSTREALDELADLCQPETSASVRRWYVDQDHQLHWYTGTESLGAPFRASDGSYLANLLATSGVVSVWSGQKASSTTLLDHKNYFAPVLVGGTTTDVASLCLNEPQLHSVTLNGSTGYAAAAGANLHPGDTFTLGIVAKRAALTGVIQTLLSASADDYQLYFNATNKLALAKENVQVVFATTDSFTSTTDTYHIVCTKSGATTHIYVNGVDQAGTTTNATIVGAVAGDINIGRTVTGGSQFYNGYFWGAFVASTAFTAAQVLALYRQWVSVSPEDLVVSYDSSGVRKRVYIKGVPGPGTGWVPGDGQAAPAESIPSFVSLGRPPEAFLNRPGSDTLRKRKKHGNAFLSNNNSPVLATQFQVTLDPTVITLPGVTTSPRPGQLMYVTNSALGLSAEPTEIKQVDVDLNMGNGVATFDVYTGALPWSAMRGKKRR